jgi:hypothetical protein
MATTRELEEAIIGWKKCVEHEQFCIDNNLCYGNEESFKLRRDIYVRMVKALEIELENGIAVCPSCFRPLETCSKDNDNCVKININ